VGLVPALVAAFVGAGTAGLAVGCFAAPTPDDAIAIVAFFVASSHDPPPASVTPPVTSPAPPMLATLDSAGLPLLRI